MKLVIAEKPAAGQDLARYLGASQKKDGYMEGNGYAVTWARGHFVRIAAAEQLGFSQQWNLEELPVIPSAYKLALVDDAYVKKQFSTIVGLMKSATQIICATDAGREGELIFRYIYTLSGLAARGGIPVRRLWVSSLTDDAYKAGFADLRPLSQYDNLYAAAKARSEADWVVGMNLTRAATIAKGERKLISLGRVQTPTLALICRRYLEHKNFVVRKFFVPTLLLEHSNQTFSVTHEKDFPTPQEARSLLDHLTLPALTCSRAERKAVVEQPPRLFDLTALQRSSNQMFGFTADQTLQYAQALYEKKLLTYPRTESSYLTTDMEATLARTLSCLAASYPQAAQLLKSPLPKRVFNNEKVGDHHALLPTELAAPQDLPVHEKNIYLLVVERLLQALSEACLKTRTSLAFNSPVGLFKATGSVIDRPGWRAVELLREKPPTPEGEEEILLPAVQQGDPCPIRGKQVREGQTKPPQLLDDSSLLGQMQSAGRYEEADLPDELTKYGIGTPATRAAILETLVKRQYVVREKKKLLPTPFGLSVYELVREKAIGNVELTGKWEYELNQIAAGRQNPAAFMQGINELVASMVNQVVSSQVKIDHTTTLDAIPCPMCKQGKMVEREKFVGCSRYKEGCKMAVNKELLGKKLSWATIKKLLTTGKTGVVEGLVSPKTGKTFDAALKLDDQGRITFVFSK